MCVGRSQLTTESMFIIMRGHDAERNGLDHWCVLIVCMKHHGTDIQSTTDWLHRKINSLSFLVLSRDEKQKMLF